MKYEMDQLLKDVYQQEVKPDKILNQKTLRRMQMKETNDMRKFWNYKRIAVAAVLSCLVVTQGVGAAYAAINHTSILSLFSGETKEIKDQAKNLREINVKQEAGSNVKQSAYADFSVREALCDKNQAISICWYLLSAGQKEINSGQRSLKLPERIPARKRSRSMQSARIRPVLRSVPGLVQM